MLPMGFEDRPTCSTYYKYMDDIQHLPHTTYWTRHDRFQLKIIFLVQAFLTQSGDLSAVKGFELKGSSITCIGTLCI
jgi:hypothetical protein